LRDRIAALLEDRFHDAAVTVAQELRGGWKDAGWVNERQDWSHTAKQAAAKAKPRDPKD